MLRPVICVKLCKACQPCQARSACNTRAIVKIDLDEPPIIALERCNGCGSCVLACGYSAIEMIHAGHAAGDGCRGS